MGGHRTLEAAEVSWLRQAALSAHQSWRRSGLYHRARGQTHPHRGEMDRQPVTRRRTAPADVSGRTPQASQARLHYLPLPGAPPVARQGDGAPVVLPVTTLTLHITH